MAPNITSLNTFLPSHCLPEQRRLPLARKDLSSHVPFLCWKKALQTHGNTISNPKIDPAGNC